MKYWIVRLKMNHTISGVKEVPVFSAAFFWNKIYFELQTLCVDLITKERYALTIGRQRAVL